MLFRPKHPIVEGVALTFGVPKAFWDRWLAANKDAMFVKNGLVFAHEQPASVEDMAKERVLQKSGLERLDPKNLPKRIQTSDLMKKAA